MTDRTTSPEDAARAARRGALLDAIFFQLVIALVAGLLVLTTVLPNRQKAERVEEEARVLELEVRARAERIALLQREVWALQSDPLYIERMLKRTTRELRPHVVRPPSPIAASSGLADPAGTPR